MFLGFCLTLPFCEKNIDSASADDPNEISFSKGEVLDIIDKNGKWWQAKKADGTVGSESLSSPVYCLSTFYLAL